MSRSFACASAATFMNSVMPPRIRASGWRMSTARWLIMSRNPYRVYSFSPAAIGTPVALVISRWPM